MEPNEKSYMVKKETLQLTKPCPKRAFAVYQSKIFLLEPTFFYQVIPDSSTFSKFSLHETKLSREYSSFAIINGTFTFVRGYSTLILSPVPNPEDSRAVVYPLKFNHGILKYAGFKNYVLSMTTGETGDREFYYFQTSTSIGSPATLNLELKKLKGSATQMVKGLIRLVQYKEAMYYVYPKKIALEYFESNTDPVEMIKQTFGVVLGVIGPYNRTVDSVHPLEGYRIGLSNNLRLRKLYTNSLQSELICKRPSGLKIPRVLKATISTRKNNLNVEVVFVEEQSHVIPPDPRHTVDPDIKNKIYEPQSSMEKLILYALLSLATAVILILVCLLRQARKNKKTLMRQIHDIMSGSPSANSVQTEGSLELSQEQSTDKPTGGQPAQEALSEDMTL